MTHQTPRPLEPLILRLLGTAKETSSPGGDETGLLTLCGVAGDGRGLTDMLMITTTVRLEEMMSVNSCNGTDKGELTWSTGFIATPRVFGHELRLTANLCLAREASEGLLVTS